MSFADDKKRKKNRPSYSLPDRLRQDKIEEKKKQRAKGETKEMLSKLQRENLQKEIELAEEKSAPRKEEKKEVAQAHERDHGAEEVIKKIQAREEAQKSAVEFLREVCGEGVSSL